MSRAELAEAVHAWVLDHRQEDRAIDEVYVGKLERGRVRWPNADYRAALRYILGVFSDADLGFFPPSRQVAGESFQSSDAYDESNHFATDNPGRDSAALAAYGVDLWELDEALSATRVCRRTLEFADYATSQLDLRYAELPPDLLMSELSRQHRHVVGWLRQPQPVTYRRRVCSIAGRLAGLRAWLLFDLAEHAAARMWYVQALRAAAEADDQPLCGWLLGGQSLIPAYGHDYRSALVLVEEGQAALGRGADPTVKTWLDLLEARARAGLGDSSGFRRAQRRANRRVQHTRPERRRHGMDFDDDRLSASYYEGTSLLSLGDPRMAREPLQASLDSLPESRIKARAILMLALAMCAARSDDVEEAATIASEAMRVGSDHPIMPIWQRAQDVRQALEPAGPSPAVTALEEGMAVFANRLPTAELTP